jgi:hypothetical protein
MDLCGLNYPKRDERDDLNDFLYLQLLDMVFCMNGLKMNDYIVEVK